MIASVLLQRPPSSEIEMLDSKLIKIIEIYISSIHKADSD